MVVFDATTLLLLLSPDVPAPLDPSTSKPVEHPKERIDFLVKQLERQKTKIIVPTPALSEILVRAGKAGPGYLEHISASAAFKIVPFDVRAAVEVAAMAGKAASGGDKRSGADGTWAKIKYDRQIVAIGKVDRATTIYTDDKDLRTFAQAASMKPISIAELPLPPEKAQEDLPLEDAPESEGEPTDEA